MQSGGGGGKGEGEGERVEGEVIQCQLCNVVYSMYKN